jgi:bacteriorhodopsin
MESAMGRYLLLWLLGVPIPILILIWAFGGLHWQIACGVRPGC